MPVLTDGNVTSPLGFTASGIFCGIKSEAKKDLALIFSEKRASCAAVFTENTVKAAPVILSMKQVSDGFAQAIIANSGIANACTGKEGEREALDMAIYTAEVLGIDPYDVVVASTGRIGERLPMKRIVDGIAKLKDLLSADGGVDAAEAILTTDTGTKTGAVKIELSSGTVTIGGIAKGSGMIAPNMATMLAFLTSDAKISSSMLQEALAEAVDFSFNAVTIDGQMSTNDMVVVMANGASETDEIVRGSTDYDLFQQGMSVLCRDLAKKIARDGEGATKFVEVNVIGCPRDNLAREFARAVAESLLVKTALYGKDPNWGRIISAMGAVKSDFSPESATITINGITVTDQGLAASVNEEQLKKEMAEEDLVISIDLTGGRGRATVWTCDLSHRYVSINSEYTT